MSKKWFAAIAGVTAVMMGLKYLVRNVGWARPAQPRFDDHALNDEDYPYTRPKWLGMDS